MNGHCCHKLCARDLQLWKNPATVNRTLCLTCTVIPAHSKSCWLLEQNAHFNQKNFPNYKQNDGWNRWWFILTFKRISHHHYTISLNKCCLLIQYCMWTGIHGWRKGIKSVWRVCAVWSRRGHALKLLIYATGTCIYVCIATTDCSIIASVNQIWPWHSEIYLPEAFSPAPDAHTMNS